MNPETSVRAIRILPAGPLKALPRVRVGAARLTDGGVAIRLPPGAADQLHLAATLLGRVARRLGARVTEPRAATDGLHFECARAVDALLVFELLGLAGAVDEAGVPPSREEELALVERLDCACGAIAGRLAAPELYVVDGVGVFASTLGCAERLALEAERGWTGWIPLPAAPAAAGSELFERVGVRGAPLLLEGGAHALLVRVAADEWGALAPRLRDRARRFLELLPERERLLGGLTASPPPAGAAAAPAAFDAEATLAALPDPSAPGCFDVELVHAGPDAMRTAMLLARAAGMPEARAAALVSSAPTRLLSGVSAHVVRSVAVALVRGAGAELRAIPVPG